MTDHLRTLFDQLRQADQSLADQEGSLEQARQQRQQAHDALWTAIEAELDATTEVHDLKDSIHRMEQMVLEQGAELRALRADLRKRENGGAQ
jgi:septal ring factor EnvC (AmiA/AmiB activator)